LLLLLPLLLLVPLQIYATYNDVVLVSKKGPPASTGSTYRLYPATLKASATETGDDGKGGFVSSRPRKKGFGRVARHIPRAESRI
jgi:hypothetical protein